MRSFVNIVTVTSSKFDSHQNEILQHPVTLARMTSYPTSTFTWMASEKKIIRLHRQNAKTKKIETLDFFLFNLFLTYSDLGHHMLNKVRVDYDLDYDVHGDGYDGGDHGVDDYGGVHDYSSFF